VASVPVSLMWCHTSLEMRGSRIFWAEAARVESLIDEADTGPELNRVYRQDFAGLIDLAGSGPHAAELLRLESIILTKKKYME